MAQPLVMPDKLSKEFVESLQISSSYSKEKDVISGIPDESCSKEMIPTETMITDEGFQLKVGDVQSSSESSDSSSEILSTELYSKQGTVKKQDARRKWRYQSMKVRKHNRRLGYKNTKFIVHHIYKIRRFNKVEKKMEHKKYYLMLIKKIANFKDVSENDIPENFFFYAWQIILKNLQEKVSTFIDRNSLDEDPGMTGHTCDECRALPRLSSFMPTILDEQELQAIQFVCSRMTEKVLMETFVWLSDETWKKNYSVVRNVLTFQVYLTALRFLMKSFLVKKAFSFPLRFIDELLLHFPRKILKKRCESDFYLGTMKMPMLQLLEFLIKSLDVTQIDILKGNLITCLHLCLFIKEPRQVFNIPKFISYFNAGWILVYNLILNQPIVVQEDQRLIFIDCVMMLMKSVIGAGEIETMSASDQYSQIQILLCAENMNRLLNALSRSDPNLQCLFHLISDGYLKIVKTVTLDCRIEVQLNAGVNSLLNHCSVQSISSQNASYVTQQT